MNNNLRYTVPFSECAMHMKIAGKPVVAVRKCFAAPYMADVWIAGQDPYQDVSYNALISEVVPPELRGKLPEFGQILVLERR